MDQNNNLQADGGKMQSILQKATNYIMVSFVVLLPIFVIPSIAAPISFSKTLLVFVVVFVLAILFILSSLRRGVVTIPRSLILLAAWFIVLLYFLSAVLSDTIGSSIFGNGFETDTVLFVAAGALLATIAAITVTSHEKILRIFPILLITAVILGVFQIIRMFAGPDFLTFGVLTDSVKTLLGRWVDMGIFFGLVLILSLLSLGGMSLHRWTKVFLYVSLAVALFSVILVNFLPIWVVLAVFSLGLLTHRYLKGRAFDRNSKSSSDESKEEEFPAEESKEKNRVATFLAIVVLAVSLFFVVWGDLAGNAISSTLGVNYIEARPSWVSTVDVARDTYKDNLLLGSGPNTFVKQWAAFRPEAVNLSNFWNADFIVGIGVIPTSFISTGLLGGLAWIVFFILILAAGVRVLIFKPSANKAVYIATLASFVGAVYLWTFSILYVAGTVLLAFAFLMTGLFVASLRGQLNSRIDKKIVLSENPRLGFITSLTLIILLLASISVVYVSGIRFAAGVIEESSQLALDNGNVDEAAEKINKAIRLNDSASSYRVATSIELTRIGAILSDTVSSQEERQTLFRETLSDAAANAQRATEIDPNDYRNWLIRARVYGSVVPLGIEGSYENAMRSYEKVIELSPRHPLPLLSMAQIEASRGNVNESRRLITEALEKKSNYTAAVFLLSQIETATGNIPDAIASTQAMTVLDPANPVFFFQLGLLQYNIGNDAAAAAALENAIGLNEDYSNARYFLGLVYARQGDTLRAIQQYESVLSLNPGNADVLRILNNLREGRGPLEDVTVGAGGAGASTINELPISGE
jgi:Tfp pilus assembly protein PilF